MSRVDKLELQLQTLAAQTEVQTHMTTLVLIFSAAPFKFNCLIHCTGAAAETGSSYVIIDITSC